MVCRHISWELINMDKMRRIWTISPENRIEGEAIRQLERAGLLTGMLRAVGLSPHHKPLIASPPRIARAVSDNPDKRRHGAGRYHHTQFKRRTRMRPGPTIIKKCSVCSELIQQHTIRSGNTFYGAIFWTDGKREAPMFPDQPRLVINRNGAFAA